MDWTSGTHMAPTQLGDESHKRTDKFSYQAQVDGMSTEVKIVFVDKEFSHVDYNGEEISHGYGRLAGRYTRNGWRLMAKINDKITELARRLNQDGDS